MKESQRVNVNEKEKCENIKSNLRRDSCKRKKITIGGILKRKDHILGKKR